MNRILFEPSEIVGGCVTLSDARAAHILKVLHGEVGQVLKTGEIDGPIGTSVITEISGSAVTVRCEHTRASLRPWVDLILAPPRPRILKRLLPQLAALGVGRIVLVGAKRVEKDFWGATLLKRENYSPLFVDGLMQSGASILPTLEVRRDFRRFVADELETLFAGEARFVAHPYASAGNPSFAPPQRLVLAIGPEGGWLDDEVARLEEHGFLRYSLGGRILRTDTATIALLAQLMPKEELP